MSCLFPTEITEVVPEGRDHGPIATGLPYVLFSFTTGFVDVTCDVRFQFTLLTTACGVAPGLWPAVGMRHETVILVEVIVIRSCPSSWADASQWRRMRTVRVLSSEQCLETSQGDYKATVTNRTHCLLPLLPLGICEVSFYHLTPPRSSLQFELHLPKRLVTYFA